MLFEGGGEERVNEGEATTPRALTLLALVLERLVARNDGLGSDAVVGSWTKAGLSVFNGVRPPSISILKYMERIYKYTDCSPSCFVVAYVYIDRLAHKHPDSLVVSLNIHRLLVTSVMVASKVLDDVHYNNAFYARVGGVSNAELNRLEMELLFLLDFGVMVSSRIFESYCVHLEKEMMCSVIGQRVEKSIFSNADAETELSVEDITKSLSLSPPTID
ncbi:cyclin-U1-1-like [Tasmannia lanceolata]|uniref:cyclin-U1-1-like n=1 Tax=Tasmannia lanceolata TaxID=3420 RepID=UPI0040642E90